MIAIKLFTLLLGLALLIKGGDIFVAAAVRIAEFLRMPRVVIGSTLVSLATTAPELFVSATAGSRGASDLALGNAVGSCICNLGLILGATALIRRVDIHVRAIRVPIGVLFLCGAALFAMTLDLTLSRFQGMVLLAAGAGYFVWDFVRHARDRARTDVAEAAAIEREAVASRWVWFRTKTGTIVQFSVGAALVLAGARLLVDSAVPLATAMGIPSMVIGLTVVAVGTSLPELVTAITSSRRKVSDLAVGNILGANVANLTLVAGLSATISDVVIDRLDQIFNLLFMLAVTGVFMWLVLRRSGIDRRGGIVLLACYGLFIVALLVLTWGGDTVCDRPLHGSRSPGKEWGQAPVSKETGKLGKPAPVPAFSPWRGRVSSASPASCHSEATVRYLSLRWVLFRRACGAEA